MDLSGTDPVKVGSRLPGTLTLVGTPIGNLSDMSGRGRCALASCDFVAAEDTRVALKLLSALGLKKPLVSYHEHNQKEQGERLCARLLAGENGALVTDAGMPSVSDPGETLVRLCREKGIPVTCAPGPSAVVTALALSGMPARRWVFEGFLPASGRERKERLAALASETRTAVLYEAPHRLRQTLSDLLSALGNRPLAVCREMTKIHEEVYLVTLADAVEKYTAEEPRGEFVLVLGGKHELSIPTSPEQAAALAAEWAANGHSPSEAARLAAAQTGVAKSEIYRLLIASLDETKEGAES